MSHLAQRHLGASAPGTGRPGVETGPVVLPAERPLVAAACPDSAKVLDAGLDELVDADVLASWTRGIYEPEETAFGGPTAMKIAHTMFHYNSRQVPEEAARQQAVSCGVPAQCTSTRSLRPPCARPSGEHGRARSPPGAKGTTPARFVETGGYGAGKAVARSTAQTTDPSGERPACDGTWSYGSHRARPLTASSCTTGPCEDSLDDHRG
ncbi:lantibiotic dehydratase C-terminal domain-containing protein [Streptomyces anthocyanicus]